MADRTQSFGDDADGDTSRRRVDGASVAARLTRWLAGVGAADAFAALADAVPDAAVFAVDADRNVVAWSRGAERMLGFAPADVLGKHCLHANRCVQCTTGCGIAEYGSVDAVPLKLYRRDGELVSVRKTGRAFFGPDGRFAGGIEVLTADAEPFALAPERVDPTLAPFHGLLSRDPQMLRVFQTVRNVAETEAPALLRGESGTGKELIARALHNESPRQNGPFVAVNCAALTPTLMESELFGHTRGAFTGAVADRVGLFRQASGGSLFLDEVAELPLQVQAKLLRALEQREVLPVGATTPLPTDVRMIAATHRSLREEVAAGRFREDLMYRLRVVPIRLPPLRDRRTDVELLARWFCGQLSVQGPRVVDRIAPEAMAALLRWPWPGNVRELRNAMLYAFATGRGPEVLASELPPELLGASAAITAPQVLAGRGKEDLRLHRLMSESEQRGLIKRALTRANGHLGDAARLLGVSSTTLWRKRKRLG